MTDTTDVPNLFDFFDKSEYPSGAIDADTAAICDLINGDPLHAADRAAIVSAVLAAAAADGGRVDPNRVRKLIPDSVYPRIIGSTYQGLVKQGVLAFTGWTISEDSAGNNVGKPARVYHLQDLQKALGMAA